MEKPYPHRVGRIRKILILVCVVLIIARVGQIFYSIIGQESRFACRRNLWNIKQWADDYVELQQIRPANEIYSTIGVLLTNRQFYIQGRTNCWIKGWRYSRDGFVPVCPASPENEKETYEGRISTKKALRGRVPIIWDKKPYHFGKKRCVLFADDKVEFLSDQEFKKAMESAESK